MTTESETQRSLGRLEGKLDMILAEQEQARFARQHQIEKSELIEKRLDATDRKLSEVTERFNEAAPVISEIQKWRERLFGMWLLLAAGFMAIGWCIGLVWKWLAMKVGAQ